MWLCHRQYTYATWESLKLIKKCSLFTLIVHHCPCLVSGDQRPSGRSFRSSPSIFPLFSTFVFLILYVRPLLFNILCGVVCLYLWFSLLGFYLLTPRGSFAFCTWQCIYLLPQCCVSPCILYSAYHWNLDSQGIFLGPSLCPLFSVYSKARVLSNNRCTVIPNLCLQLWWFWPTYKSTYFTLLYNCHIHCPTTKFCDFPTWLLEEFCVLRFMLPISGCAPQFHASWPLVHLNPTFQVCAFKHKFNRVSYEPSSRRIINGEECPKTLS